MKPEAREAMASMLTPASLAIVTATLIIWAGSHAFVVGEIVDVILVCIGAVTVGLSFYDGAREVKDFAVAATGARSDAGIDVAARHFARAATILGITLLQAVLLHGQARTLRLRGRPRLYQIESKNPPELNSRLKIKRPKKLFNPYTKEPISALVDEWGTTIEISRDQPLSQQRIALLHEIAHRYLIPRAGMLREIRNEARIAGYGYTVLLRYLEEALAEGYAQLRRNGLLSAVKALYYPLKQPMEDGDPNGEAYVTIAHIYKEGKILGTIMLGGNRFYVSITHMSNRHRPASS